MPSTIDIRRIMDGGKIPTWASAVWQRVLGRANRISPEAGDALLYGASALFALLTIYTSSNALYQVWSACSSRSRLWPHLSSRVSPSAMRASAASDSAVRRTRDAPPTSAATSSGLTRVAERSPRC